MGKSGKENRHKDRRFDRQPRNVIPFNKRPEHHDRAFEDEMKSHVDVNDDWDEFPRGRAG